MSVLETIIGKVKPKFEAYEVVLDLVQRFLIESKSLSSVSHYTLPQQTIITMYTFGALAYLSEAHKVAVDEIKVVLELFLQRKGYTEDQAQQEAKTIFQQADDPNMKWNVETGYNAARYWHKDNDTSAPKALARLLKTTR